MKWCNVFQIKGIKTATILVYWRLSKYQKICEWFLEHRSTWTDKGLLRKVYVKHINCIKRAAKPTAKQQTDI